MTTDLYRIDLNDLRSQAAGWRAALTELPSRSTSDTALLRRVEGALVGAVAAVEVLRSE